MKLFFQDTRRALKGPGLPDDLGSLARGDGGQSQHNFPTTRARQDYYYYYYYSFYLGCHRDRTTPRLRDYIIMK